MGVLEDHRCNLEAFIFTDMSVGRKQYCNLMKTDVMEDEFVKDPMHNLLYIRDWDSVCVSL